MSINTRIKHKRDTSSNWTTNNPVLLDGELIIVDTNDGDIRFKIGDGTKTYTQLPFTDETLYNDLSNKADKSSLATVATSGSYNDLIDKPSVGDVVKGVVTIDSNNVSSINIPITITDVNTLTVYHNGLILTPTIQYTATTSAITLVDYTADKGDIFTFIGTTQAGVALNAEASEVLFSDSTTGEYTNCNNVKEALVKAASFKNVIESISVNGTDVSPTNKKVNIVIPETDVPIKSITEYSGTALTPDNNGAVKLPHYISYMMLNDSGDQFMIPNDNGEFYLNSCAVLITGTNTLRGDYTVSGNLYVKTPTVDTHAVTKKYVDDLIGDVNTVITNINNIVGGN